MQMIEDAVPLFTTVGGDFKGCLTGNKDWAYCTLMQKCTKTLNWKSGVTNQCCICISQIVMFSLHKTQTYTNINRSEDWFESEQFSPNARFKDKK